MQSQKISLILGDFVPFPKAPRDWNRNRAGLATVFVPGAVQDLFQL